MELKTIFAVEKDELLLSSYSDTYRGLKKYRNEYGSFKRGELFDEIFSSSGYARKTYRGKIKDNIELTELELSMICDSGYSHFGGSSKINTNKTFSVTIYTD